MILSAKINGSLAAEFDLNFTSKTWALPPAGAKWGNVMYSDRGTFEVKPWGVIWLMDGLRSEKKDIAVILHDAPTAENDALHESGTGRVYAAAIAKYKDAAVAWRVVRPSAAAATGAGKCSCATTKIRVKARSIAESLLPPAGKLTNGQRPAGVSGTACGEFPGRVLRRMPVAGPPQSGAFSLDVPGSGRLALTSPTTHWEPLAKAIDQKFKPVKKTWTDFSGSNRPKTGDIYILSKFEDKSQFQHVGMIICSQGDKWITADGGQGNGWQSGFVNRRFYSTGQIDGEFGNKAWLKGWVDLDNLREVLAPYFPSDLA